MLFQPTPSLARLQASTRPTSLAGGPFDTISFAIGDPDFDTPRDVVEAGVQALRAGFTHYTDWNGDPDLRRQIVESESHRAAGDYDVENTVVGHGATGVLFAAIATLVGPGDRVALPEPTYSLYADLVRLAGGVPVFVPLLPSYHLDLDRLEHELPKAKLVILCSPGNPTGAVFTRQELAAVAALADRHDTWVLSDETYSGLVYSPVTFASALELPQLTDRLIYCQTLSKTYAMTGWRVGYALAPAAVAEGMRQIHRTINGSLNSAAQRAALAALQIGDGLAAGMLEAYSARREYMHSRISQIDALSAERPDGAFYYFVRYSAPFDSFEMTDRLRAAGVVVRAGREYGPSGEGQIRLSFATDLDTIALGMDGVAEAFATIHH